MGQLSDAIQRMSDEEAEDLFCEIRFRDGIVCPRCSARDHYYIATRRLWDCAQCRHRFSPTSGTIFSGHKLSLKQCLHAMALYEESGGKIAAWAMKKAMGVNYRTAYILKRKLETAPAEGGPMASKSYLWSGYWQFGVWRLGANGQVQRQNRRTKQWHDHQ